MKPWRSVRGSWFLLSEHIFKYIFIQHLKIQCLIIPEFLITSSPLTNNCRCSFHHFFWPLNIINKMSYHIFRRICVNENLFTGHWMLSILSVCRLRWDALGKAFLVHTWLRTEPWRHDTCVCTWYYSNNSSSSSGLCIPAWLLLRRPLAVHHLWWGSGPDCSWSRTAVWSPSTENCYQKKERELKDSVSRSAVVVIGFKMKRKTQQKNPHITLSIEINRWVLLCDSIHD